jgi:dipeptidyl aminopeptidase/acylaminoacyl peptidase
VGERRETLVDRSRPTAANASAPATPERTLPTVFFYPAAGEPGGDPVEGGAPATGGPWPLVVFSHGYSTNADVYRNMIRWWAAAGYVVAAPTFPLSNNAAPGGPNVADYRNQPADVSFVIDQVLRADRDRAHVLYGLVDETRIGVAGHSLGGLTTFGVAFNTCCIDERIEAALAMSSLRAPFGGSSFFPDGGDTPVLIIHGDADQFVPFANSRTYYAEARRPKYLLTLHGEDHTVAFTGGRGTPAGNLVIDASVDFLDRYLKGRRDGVERLQRAVASEGRADLQLDAAA